MTLDVTTKPDRADAAVERFTRWTAGRTTRRSFLHRLGQLAVLVAAGPTIAGFLLKRAEARVCGQTGVTPKCDTFDCVGPGDVWGWCWYASDGCCRNNGLKKICDCCTVNYPNVHGYCPSGTNVRCIVESCGTDPRVLDVDLVPVDWSATGYTRSAIRTNHPQATRAVIASAEDRSAQLVAAPLAGALGAPMLAVGSGGPTTSDRTLLRERGVSKVLLVGELPAGTAEAFEADGIASQVISASGEPVTLSTEVAAAIRRLNDINRSVTVATTGLSAAAAPMAAAMAAVNGFPLALGTDAAVAIGMPTVFVGPEAEDAPADADLPTERTKATNLADLSIELAELATASPFVNALRLTIAPDGSADLIDLVNLGTPIVLHPATRLGTLESWLQEHSARYGVLQQVYFTRGPGELTTEEYWKLQGAVNGFRVDQLMGVAGEGLPVFRQPLDERPVGKARTDGAIPAGSVTPPSYWTDLGQTLRN